ncbi:hypothetical protein [Psittacicella hinzii]|uniref:Uncharacterized protein n=1 Tax=Psittacicella hinzii TaxID=2028575 RepID=A0A3A1YRE5_9GAMM|nr:hypothetical protein [Psittacicella hinzii]RIY38617.1 hypothetical protein CKF58_03900 [Psittacicella hinzii]
MTKLTPAYLAAGQIPQQVDLLRQGDQTVQQDDFRKLQTKVEAYALIPVYQEAVTLSASLETIKQAFTQGVLVYAPPPVGVQADQSLEIATAFVEENPGFKLAIYPSPIVPQHNPWLAEYMYEGGFSVYWLYHNFFNFGFVQLQELIKLAGHEEAAWIAVLDPQTIYDSKGLDSFIAQLPTLGQTYDAWRLDACALAFNHESMFTSASLFKRLIGKVGLQSSEQYINPQVLNTASLHFVGVHTSAVSYFVRYSQIQHFNYVYASPFLATQQETANHQEGAKQQEAAKDKAKTKAKVKLAERKWHFMADETQEPDPATTYVNYAQLALKPNTQVAPTSLLCGYRLAYETQVAYHGVKVKDYKAWLEQVTLLGSAAQAGQQVINNLTQALTKFVTNSQVITRQAITSQSSDKQLGDNQSSDIHTDDNLPNQNQTSEKQPSNKATENTQALDLAKSNEQVMVLGSDQYAVLPSMQQVTLADPQDLVQIFAQNKEFWSLENAASWLELLNYPHVAQLLTHPQQYLSLTQANYVDLLTQSKYRLEEWLNGFNLSLSQEPAGTSKKFELEAQAQILRTYFGRYALSVKNISLGK